MNSLARNRKRGTPFYSLFITRAVRSWRLLPSRRLHDEKRSNRQDIHSCALETVDSLFGGAYDGLILVEAGIQDGGKSALPEGTGNRIVGAGIFFVLHRQQPA